MYQLYAMFGSCSMAIHVLLNELNQPVEVIQAMENGKVIAPEFSKVSPTGQVPVLVEDGFAMTEGGAILNYLMEKHQSPLLPTSGHARATALQWLAFANATLHPAYGRVFFGMRTLEDGAVKDKYMAVACDKINQLWALVDAQLAKHRYVCGDAMTGADILLTVIANWSPRMPKPIALGSNVKRLLGEISARPAFQKALAAEKVEYKAAA